MKKAISLRQFEALSRFFSQVWMHIHTNNFRSFDKQSAIKQLEHFDIDNSIQNKVVELAKKRANGLDGLSSLRPLLEKNDIEVDFSL